MNAAPIQKLLIANRGEIAVRIARTARRLGIATVAVFSDADADMPHVAACDEAVRIGPAPSRESYLVIEKLIAAAKLTGADAIHPGYGFLSERAEFAAACEEAGITFVGPSSASIAAMGSKKAAKELVSMHGVPVVPGYAGADQSDETLCARALDLGFPVLVKASAGGGGKGMRVVREAGALAEAVAGAKREALSSFGDDTLIIERYVDEPRHIEIQILGDRQGNLVHLFERECSIQRRHQKVIEESPSVFLTPELREKMGAAAVAAGKAIGYFNAGTVEFITAPDGAFYFLEVNTRLQVEHPVTELVTGLDLVELQLRIAEGGALPFAQGDLVSRGAALECRLYAEDPEKGFLPGGGPVVDWHLPEVEGLRVDTGVQGGSQIPNDYDPMIAKVITWGRDREEARRRMVRSLEQMSAMGTANNRAFLLRVLEHPAYREGAIHTHFIAQHEAELVGQGGSAETLARAVAAAGFAGTLERAAEMPVPGLQAGFRLLRGTGHRQAYTVGEQELTLVYSLERNGSFAWTVGDISGSWRLVSRDGARLVVESAEGWRRSLRVVQRGEQVFVHLGREEVMLREVPRFIDPASRKVEGGCVAPMPGKVVKVAVAVGDTVVRGQALLVMEAMKMEHTIAAPEAGRVAVLSAVEGQQVEGGQLLAVLEPYGPS